MGNLENILVIGQNVNDKEIFASTQSIQIRLFQQYRFDVLRSRSRCAFKFYRDVLGGDIRHHISDYGYSTRNAFVSKLNIIPVVYFGEDRDNHQLSSGGFPAVRDVDNSVNAFIFPDNLLHLNSDLQPRTLIQAHLAGNGIHTALRRFRLILGGLNLLSSIQFVYSCSSGSGFPLCCKNLILIGEPAKLAINEVRSGAGYQNAENREANHILFKLGKLLLFEKPYRSMRGMVLFGMWIWGCQIAAHIIWGIGWEGRIIASWSNNRFAMLRLSDWGAGLIAGLIVLLSAIFLYHGVKSVLPR